ncbi:hypothetical protein C362_03074 [Cryptococcus neoformans Bt1]|nr:hypothetical protein C362_03074 [Cryptococcus neoformans var. grubii Bt1]
MSDWVTDEGKLSIHTSILIHLTRGEREKEGRGQEEEEEDHARRH